MQPRRYFLPVSIIGFLLLIASGILLATAHPVSAQCGSATSSCKNCHEVQGKKPVNNDGTSWHQSHAFGDFCYICHGGNSQATDETEAHKGMVPPLSDIKASCQSCHANDLDQRAQVYATKLGVTLGSSGSSNSASSTKPTPPPANPDNSTSSAAPASSVVMAKLDVNDPNLVDYAQTYDQIVMGKKPVNWGNVTLLAIIALVLIGGGGFVITNEKLVKVSFGDTRKVEGEYPGEVVDMLTPITRLSSQARKSLKKILDKPEKSAKVFGLIDEIVSDEQSEAKE